MREGLKMKLRVLTRTVHSAHTKCDAGHFYERFSVVSAIYSLETYINQVSNLLLRRHMFTCSCQVAMS